MEDPLLEQMGLWEVHSGVEQKCKKEVAAERNCCVLTVTRPFHVVASLRGLCVARGDSKGRGLKFAVKESS